MKYLPRLPGRSPGGAPPPGDRGRGTRDRPVLLGGALDTLLATPRPDIPRTEAAERMTAAAALARTYPAARIVFTGGSGSLLYGGPTEGELARRFFAGLG